MADYKPYCIQTLADVVRKVKSLTFEPLKRDRNNFQKARVLVPIPALLEFLGLPVTRNQPCWFCRMDAHTSDTSLSIYINRNKGCWWYYVESCYSQGDVSDAWERIVQLCRGVPFPEWDGWMASADLVARAERGEIDCNSVLPAAGGREEGRPWVHAHKHTSIITRNFGELHRLKKRVKVKPPGSVTLPRPVNVGSGEVLLRFFPDEGYVWIGEKFNWGHTQRRNVWLADYGTIGSKKCQYFVPNYLRPLHIRNRAGIRERRWIVVEADRYSLEQQYWIHLQLSEWLHLGCLCWSGGSLCMARTTVGISLRTLCWSSIPEPLNWE